MEIINQFKWFRLENKSLYVENTAKNKKNK